jgi:hypothetical protein
MPDNNQEKGKGNAQREQDKLPTIVVADAWFMNELVETMLIPRWSRLFGNK